MKELITGNKYFYGSVVILAVLESILLALTSKAEVSLWVNVHWYIVLDQLLLLINNMGTAIFSVLAGLVLWLCKGRHIALKAAVCLLSVMLITQFAKHILFPGTPRPTLYFAPGVLRLVEGVKQLTTESFPSGHTSASFALATFFALYWPHKQWHWTVALLAFTVSYARVYLSQHFITDVYAGMLVGVLVTTLVYYYYPSKSRQQHD
jgi:membrane-associated phospholipid phosphatase